MLRASTHRRCLHPSCSCSSALAGPARLSADLLIKPVRPSNSTSRVAGRAVPTRNQSFRVVMVASVDGGICATAATAVTDGRGGRRVVTQITFRSEGRSSSTFGAAVRALWFRSQSGSPAISLTLPPVRSLAVARQSSYRPGTASTGPPPGVGDASPDLAAVLVAVGAKDPEAFQILYEQCARRVYGVVRKTLQNPDSCAEVTQEVFLMVWEQGDRYRPELGHPMSWLATLAHRRAVDRLRMDITRRARDEKWGRRNWDTGFDEVAETALERESTAEVQAAMSVLSPLQHQAISLAYFSHLTYNEVADRLGIPGPTAKTRIRDGLKRLRRELEGQRGSAPR